MDRWLVICVITLGLILSGLAFRMGEVLALAIPFVIYLISGIFFYPQKPDLVVKKVIEPARAFPRTPVRLRLIIENKGDPIDLIHIEDPQLEGLNVDEGSRQLISKILPGGTVELSYTVSGRRGIYRFSDIQCTNIGKVGLFERTFRIPSNGELFILPDIPRIKRVSLRSLYTRTYSGNNPTRMSGTGTDFHSVRDYHPGDPLRYINWRHTARHPVSLYTNEFERQRVSDIWVILDGRQRSNLQVNGEDLFEHTILAGSGLARALLSDGNRVGLLVYGSYLQWTLPGYGKIQRERILRTLAQAQPGNLFIFSDLDNLPTRAFPVSSQLVLITPLHPEDIPIILRLHARGYSLFILSPDPVRFEREVLGREAGGDQALRIAKVERQLLIRQLINGGVPVTDWDISLPFERVILSQLGHTAWKNHPSRRITL